MPDIITQDILFFFDGRPVELELYEQLAAVLMSRHPESEIRVKKTQVGFYCPSGQSASSPSPSAWITRWTIPGRSSCPFGRTDTPTTSSSAAPGRSTKPCWAGWTPPIDSPLKGP